MTFSIFLFATLARIARNVVIYTSFGCSRPILILSLLRAFNNTNEPTQSGCLVFCIKFRHWTLWFSEDLLLELSIYCHFNYLGRRSISCIAFAYKLMRGSRHLSKVIENAVVYCVGCFVSIGIYYLTPEQTSLASSTLWSCAAALLRPYCLYMLRWREYVEIWLGRGINIYRQ